MARRRHRLGWVLLLLAFVLAVGVTTAVAEDEPKPAPRAPAGDAAPAVPQPNAEAAACLECHASPEKDGKHPFTWATFARSVHAGQDCTNCHDGFAEYPHPKDAKPMSCEECHEEEAAVVAKTVHASGPRPGSSKERAAACKDCHGVHDVLKASDPASRLHPFNVPTTCGQCHGGPEARAAAEAAGRPLTPMDSAGRYTDDTHAEALLRSGLIVAPTCITCHGGHDVVATKDPRSHVHPDNVAATCGSCHVGILDQYRKSVHGMTPRDAGQTANQKLPATCTDCHPPHHIEKPGTHFKVEIVERCSGCHKEKGSTYRGTYHGKVTNLGFGGEVASCDECHTAHSILPTDDPHSSVNPANRTATCAKCHEGATPEFATYAVHANPKDRENWPVLYWGETIMRGLITVVWILAGIHILLWWQRALRERKHLPHHAPLEGRWYQRWPPFYRALHITVASTFLLLALTGLPLRFHDEPWSDFVYQMLGGPGVVRFLHHFGGVVTFGYFAAYLVHIVRRLLKGEKGLFRGPTTMLPRWKDAQDIRANFRWFLKGGPRPHFDRWTYWEKFDFWAEVWGVGFIGITGLMMWFPIETTSVFPGWVINLAHILHSYEALLATGFIFSVHFFHANLRPGKFPMDPIIFTGRIPEEELKLERPAEYERMKADGRLEREALPPPDPVVVRRAYIVGGTLLVIGLLLLVGIVYSLWS